MYSRGGPTSVRLRISSTVAVCHNGPLPLRVNLSAHAVLNFTGGGLSEDKDDCSWQVQCQDQAAFCRFTSFVANPGTDDVTISTSNETEITKLMSGISATTPQLLQNFAARDGILTIKFHSDRTQAWRSQHQDSSNVDSKFALEYWCGDFVEGCTDHTAANYDPAATVDNGHCITACHNGPFSLQAGSTPAVLNFTVDEKHRGDCAWQIECDAKAVDQTAVLRFTAVRLSPQNHVSIADNRSTALGGEVISGQHAPPFVFIARNGTMHVRFQGDFQRFANTTDTFAAQYWCTDVSTLGCPDTLCQKACITRFASGASCQECPPGRFHLVSSNEDQCRRCAVGSLCRGGALSVSLAVSCPGGTQPDAAGEHCERCPTGTFRSPDTTVMCMPCASTEEPNSGGTGCTCKAGHFDSGSNASAGLRVACLSRSADVQSASLGPRWTAGCTPCDGLAFVCVDCPGGSARPTPLAGFATVKGPTNDQMVVFECPDIAKSGFRALGHSGVCLAGGGCAEGNTGPLCHICEPAYSHSRDGSCNRCPSSAEATQAIERTALVLGAAIVLLLAWRVLCGRRRMLASVSDSTNNPLMLHDSSKMITAGDDILAAIDPAICSLSNRPSSGAIGALTAFMPAAVGQDGSKVQNVRNRWKMLVQVNIHSIRIVVGFGQVVGQLGTVLHVEYPRSVTLLLGNIKALVAFDFLDGLSCLGVSGFFARWAARVFVVPALMLLVCALLHCWKVQCTCRRQGASASQDQHVRQHARDQLRTNVFAVVFVLYPSVCHWTFAAFSCRQLSAGIEVLVADYGVVCYDYGAGQIPLDYLLCFAASVVVAVLVAFGAPMVAGIFLYQKNQMEHSCGKDLPAVVSAHVAAVLSLRSSAEAAELIHEVKIGKDYGFLLSAYRSSCYGWERECATFLSLPSVR